jgi:hypothetical protein
VARARISSIATVSQTLVARGVFANGIIMSPHWRRGSSIQELKRRKNWRMNNPPQLAEG